MTGPNIHQVERGELKRRWSLALVLSVAIAMIVATWIGLFGFLGVNAAYATFDRLLDRWLPQIETEPTLLAFPDLSRVSHVYTEDGTLLAELHAGRISEPVRFVDVPEILVNAILAAEDGDYFDHQGVDFTAIASAIRDHVTGVDRRGGSTITQQVVKNNIVGDEQTIQRKILEALYAIELEQRHTKQEILQFYMNSVYFGWSAYGVAAAAREYFDKEELADLTIAEAATLAVTIRNPTLYDPRRQPERAEDRRNDVIDAMAAAGDISYEAAAAAKEAPFLIQQPEPFTSPAEHVVAEVRRQILNDREFDEHLGFTNAERRQALFGCPAHEEDCEGGGGLNVYVTVDLDLQSAANRILRSWLPLAEEDSIDTRGAPTGAIAMVENHTGAVLAMSSGLPFEQEQFDLVIQGRRNPGSAFKPFVLVAYLEAGGSLQSYWDARSPLEIECEDPCGPDGGYVWTVRNAGSVDDLLTVAQATERSVNTVYAQLSVLVGPRAIIRTAHKMGITSDLEEVYSLALGAGVVSPLEMASAYSTFATNGAHAEPYLISLITTDEGEVIYQRQVETTQAIDPVLAAAVRRPMERVVCCGTARRADIEGVPQAGKTGTHQAYRDAWFVGYVPNFTTAVWVGYPDEQISLEDVVINGETYSRVFGGSVPAPIWKEFMEVVLDKYPAGEFPGSLGIGYYNELPFTQVPELSGMSATAARNAVLGAHLMAQVEEVLSPEPQGTVVASDPPAGLEVDQGSTVTIQVAGGTSVLVVPALEGLSSEEALEAIQVAQESAGTAVAIEILYQAADDPEMVDRVLLTLPSAGELLPTDGALSLVIGS